MEKITLQEMNWLIDNGYLKNVRGKYNGLITGSKLSHGKKKLRMVEEPIFKHLEKMYKKQENKKISSK